MVQIKLSQLTMSYAGAALTAIDPLPAMQRRRLSSIAKLALNSAIECLDQHPVDYIVWCSQYGDENKTYKILADVLQDLTPSPTQFATSVHNAIAGLYSILCQDSTPSTSLCASWSEALVEAYAFLKLHAVNGTALVVYYDEPLPELYNEYHDFKGFSMAALIALDTPNLQIDLNAINHDHAYKYTETLAFHCYWSAHDPQSCNQYAWQKCSD